MLTRVWSSFQQWTEEEAATAAAAAAAPQFWHFTSILTFWPFPSSWASWRREWWRWQGFRIFSPRHWYGQVLFENGPRLVNLIPQSLYSTAAYGGSPPCTLSWHPYTRETGNSNVLGDDQQIRVGGNNQIRETSGDWSRRIKYGKVIG